MVYEPVNWIEKCAHGQADRIIGHIEHMGDQVEFVGKVQEVGASVGLALDLETTLDDLDLTILNNLEVVLLMSVPAGFGGQKFNNKVISKIKRLSSLRKRDQASYKIQVDGGVNLDNIRQIRKTGADEVSVGRSLFDGDLKENLEIFKKAVGSEGNKVRK
jgi:ribulose-phosphate 3-epimerase